MLLNFFCALKVCFNIANKRVCRLEKKVQSVDFRRAMKTILIMRHGEAEPLIKSDETRALTAYGQAQASQIGLWLSQQSFAPTGFLVSPFVRAQQTAAQVLSFNPAIYHETCVDIVPSGNAAVAIDYLETLISMNPNIDSWLVVSHMPIVSYLVDQLCPGNLPIFPTAACALINYDEITSKATFGAMHVPQD